MNLSPLDLQRLHQALEAAGAAIGLSDPNPRVGCVLADRHGEVVAVAHTQQAGGPHAEAQALHLARQAGRPLQGGTAWVTLEPCAHHGRTPPCADALLAAGLARVVVGTLDPFPQVAGQGVARLRAAGIAVQVCEDAGFREAALALNIGFFSRVLRGRPWVRLKAAASADGRTALPDGRSQWITGAAARADGHAWRRRAGAVLTGIGTVQADDPRLDVRLVPTVQQPLRVVLDSRLTMARQARLLQPPGQVLVVGAGQAPEAGSDLWQREQALQARGAQLLWLPRTPAGDGIALAPLLQALAQRGINELHVEAGARLNAAMLREGWVDELLLYLAPSVIGPGRGLVDWPTLPGLEAAVRLRWLPPATVGEDLRLRACSEAAATFLTGTWLQGVSAAPGPDGSGV